MNELVDKLIVRLALTIFLCLLLLFYKYLHAFFYPSSRSQLTNRFSPGKNGADSLHFFSRILGIGFIFSELTFDNSHGFLWAITSFFIISFLCFILYIASIYVIESIVLYNFEHGDEILRRKNYSYSIISFTHSIALALMIKTILMVSGQSIIFLVFLWPFTIVLLGFSTKTYKYFSTINFNKTLIQKNISVSLAYSGFFWGWTLIILSALKSDASNIKWYAIWVILRILLSLLILPIFRLGLVKIYQITQTPTTEQDVQPDVGEGIAEGALFLTSCMLTIVITTQINFGTFYPVF